MAIVDKNKIDEFINQIQDTLNNLSDNDTLITSIILDIIKNYLSSDLYENIPEELDKILSTQDFTSSVDLSKKMLISYGIPEYLVDKLSIVDIQKILKSLQLFLSDYSTIKFIKDIVDLFDEDIYIAELNLVYNKNTNDVYLVPNWIIEPPKELKNEYSIISYDAAYNSIPELLITKDEWITQFQNNNAVSPLKTNILLIVADNQQSISILNEIISQVIFNYLKDKKLTLYYDKTFEIQFEDIIKLYYYIIALFKNIDKLTINQPNIVDVKYSAENNNIPYSELETLLSKYNNIKDKDTYNSFIQYINQNFSYLSHPQPTEYDFLDLQTYLYTKYPSLIQYLNSLYNNSTNKEYDLYSLIIKTRKSISITFYNISYINIFIENYFFVNQIAIEDRLSYQFINYYKPVNILILNEIIDYVLFTIDNKLTNLYLESFIKSIYITKQSVDNNPIRYDKNFIIDILNKSIQFIFSAPQLSLILTKKETLTIKDYLDLFSYEKRLEDKLNINENINLSLDIIIDYIRFYIKNIVVLWAIITKQETLSLKDKSYLTLTSNQYNFFQIQSRNDINNYDVFINKSPRFMINDFFNIIVT